MKNRIIHRVLAGVLILTLVSGEAGTAGVRYVQASEGDRTYIQTSAVSDTEISLTSDTAAAALLEDLLKTYFPDRNLQEISSAVAGLETETRLSMTDDYEEVLAAQNEADEKDEELQEILAEIKKGLADAAEQEDFAAPALYSASLLSEPQTAVELEKLGGEGSAFMYYNFVETTEFSIGTTYAFLNDIYGPDDAVSMLGSGAILKAAEKASNNNSLSYIRGWYGVDASVTVYVDVVTKGKGFDHCSCGGLYTVPGTSAPTEYRYFCKAGGAQNCGPLYAYTYDQAELTYENVSASLNDMADLGSADPEDYTVTLSYDDKEVVLAPSGYTVSTDETGKVTIVVSDDDGNRITTRFQGPVGVYYSGEAEGVTGVPEMQGTEYGQNVTLNSQIPRREGYEFQNWTDQDGREFDPGTTVTSLEKTLRLEAQWRDTQPPQISYNQVQVLTRTSDADVREAVESALTVTDNEPVEECATDISLPSDIARKAGNVAFTVTVTDKAGNKTEEMLFIDVVARPVSFDAESWDSFSRTLTAVVEEPGAEAARETGFVWGIMNNPTITLNNGKAATVSPVTEPQGALSVTADGLQEGVNYYARAYLTTVDGVTYYSDEITFGLGIPSYGTFTITNNGDNTFTVTRTGGTDGEQTVYYRTVNGSAVGGTHFTHQADTLIFAEGETSKIITVTEAGANTAYGSDGATAYTNADRTYSVELYRVTGGASLGDTATAMRTMTAGDEYKVNRNIYTTENVKGTDYSSNPQWVTDRSGTGDGRIYWVSNRDENTNPGKVNFNSNASIAGRYSDNIISYIRNTADSYLYRYVLGTHEDEDCWEHVWMGTHAPNNAGTTEKLAGSYTDDPISLTDSVAGDAIWTANFQLAEGDDVTKYFPTSVTNNSVDNGTDPALRNTVYRYNAADNVLVSRGNNTYARIGISDTVYNYFSASGASHDRWYVTGFTDYTLIDDNKEPQPLAVAPMAGGLYKVGDTYTVSVIFDEIVDSTNSALTEGNVYLSTSWGRAYYAGGADTNVLYFTGTVINNPEETLRVTGMAGTDLIKDMCSTSGTAAVSVSGTTAATVDANIPDFTVRADGIENGTGTAVVTVNEDKDNTSSLRYVWSDSSVMPVSGWVEAGAEELEEAKSSQGLTLGIRKEAGSGSSNGKWYLHVLGIYSTTGATAYSYVELDFGTIESPAPGSTPPTLEVSVDNTDWARSRQISISASASGSSASLQYRSPGGTAWNTLNLTDTGITVIENGYYTFMLTAGDQTVTESVLVEKIDQNAPGAVIGLPSENTVPTSKEGVYTAVSLPVTFSDMESGIDEVQYIWSSSVTEPEEDAGWQTFGAEILAAGRAEVTYEAVEDTETGKYLHIKATDKVGRTSSAVSSEYMVISREAADGHTPEITLTGEPEQWTNDAATLRWELTGYEGKDYTVTLPDGTVSEASEGNFLATQNGTYTVTVTDNEYGGSNSAQLTVDKLDFTGPAVTVTGISDDWTGSGQTVSISAEDGQSGAGDVYYAIVSSNQSIPEDSALSKLGSAGTVTVGESGTWYIYYKAYDRAGNPDVQREANITQGFSAPVRVDTTVPEFTIGGGTEGTLPAEGLELTLTVKYGPSGGQVSAGSGAIEALSSSGSGTKTTKYTVNAKGEHTFVITKGTGNTSTEKVKVYEAALNAGQGTGSQNQIVVSGGKLAVPEASRQGYDLDGWYTSETGGDKWEFEKNAVSGDITLYARWSARSDTEYKINHWTQNMDGEDEPYNSDNYTLADTEEKTGTTDSTLILSELAGDFAGCSYDCGIVGGKTVDTATVLPDGTLEINLYYSRDSIEGTVTVKGTNTVDGMEMSGSTLTAELTDSNVPADTVLSYQWYYVGSTAAENEEISGADKQTYLLTDNDIGKKLGVRVTAQDYRGELNAQLAKEAGALLSGSIDIAGNAVIGSVLSINSDSLSPAGATVSWQWYRVDSDGQKFQITGADSDRYILTAADYGYKIQAQAAGTGYYKGNLQTSVTEAVEKKNQTMPSVFYDDETIDNKNDGAIHGLNRTTMEYRSGMEGEYQDFLAGQFADGTFFGLADGVYQIRLKETAECSASEPVTVTIKQGGYYQLTLPEVQTGYTLTFQTESDSQASHNGTSSIVFELKEGYSATGNFAIALSDGTKGRITEPQESTEGTYVISDITGDISVEVSGVQDVTPPEVKVEGVSDDWENSTQTITLTPSDSGSGVAQTLYKVVNSDSESPAEGLEELPDDGKVSVSGDGIWYIYYQVSDKAAQGNNGGETNITEGFAGPVRIDTKIPKITVSGGMEGTPADEGIRLTLTAVYGLSGGRTVLNGSGQDEAGEDVSDGEETDKDEAGKDGNGVLLDELTAGELPADGEDRETTLSTEYIVTAGGDYTFTATSGAGLANTASVTIHEASLYGQNGTETQIQLTAENGKLTEPRNPERQGYTFEGWYTDAAGGKKWDFQNSTVTADIKLYAHWTEIKMAENAEDKTPSAPETQDSSVQTGDDFDWGWAVLMTVSLLMAATAAVLRKKRER